MSKKAVEKLTVDLTPISTFRYCQVSNHKFNYLLLDKELRALHTPFECKDYLQDMFYSEYTGKSIDIWGISWKQGMIDMSQDFFNLAMMGGDAELESKASSVQKLLNALDKAQGIPLTKVLPTTNPKIVVIRFSKQWTKNGPTLSAFTTLIRLAWYYQGEDPMEYLEKLSGYVSDAPGDLPVFMMIDMKRLNITLPKFKALFEGVTVDYGWENFVGMNVHAVHDTGIVNFKAFPTATGD